MQNVTDNEIILDIQRVARRLNTNKLSLNDYLNNGGKYSGEVIDDPEWGSFGSRCELAGIKVIMN